MTTLFDIDFGSLNYIDIGVFLIIGLSVLFAFLRGFIKSMLTLAGWILSIILTHGLFPIIQPYLAAEIKSPLLVILVGYSGLLLISLIIFAILNSFVSAALIVLQQGIIDRTLGILFGLFRGGLIVSFMYLSFTIIANLNLSVGNGPNSDNNDYIPEVIQKAQTYKLLNIGKNALSNFIPGSLDKSLQIIKDNLQYKSFDEKFISSSKKKLYQYMDDHELDEIESLEKLSTAEGSDENTEMMTLNKLLENYNKKLTDGAIQGDKIPDSDINRLENIMKSKNNKVLAKG